MLTKTFLAATIALASQAACGQHGYAGQQHRDIKSLSATEVSDLLQGQGMGLANAAELNGYPGPAHALEHAVALSLTPEQTQATHQLMEHHRHRAQRLGTDLVAAERAMDRAFAHRQIDEGVLARLTADIGRLQGELRMEHLRTHLAQAALLTELQIRRYAQLRGYGEPASAPAPAGAHTGRH